MINRVLSLALFLLLLLPACSPGSESVGDGRPNVLLVTIDTLRADAVGCYGSEAGPTPHLDALAARGVRFETAWSVTPLTTPSHATMLTGTYPGTHGIRSNGRLALGEDAVTLAELLSEAGYTTAAAVA